MDSVKVNWRTQLVSFFHSWRTQRRSLICACIACALGVSSTLLAEEWWIATQPHKVIIKSINVKTVPNFKNSKWLNVYLIGAPARGCVRLTQHLIYREKDTIRQYIPLGSALSGLNYSSSYNEIEVSLELPPGIEGEWNYVNRSLFHCTIWPGLLKMVQEETPPTKVMINDNPYIENH